MSTTYYIPEIKLAEFADKLATINKRAAKLGVAPITSTQEHDHTLARVKSHPSNDSQWIGEESLEEFLANPNFSEAADLGERMPVYEVSINGATPHYADWELVAVLEPLSVDGGEVLNLVMGVPGAAKCPHEFRNRIGQCDHCKANRRRKQTFVVRHTVSNEFKCVGRQCLGDFLGAEGNDPHRLAAWAELLAEFGTYAAGCEDEEYWGAGGYAPAAWALDRYVAIVAACIDAGGWTARWGKDKTTGEFWRNDNATADQALQVIDPPKNREKIQDWLDARQATEAHQTEAEAAIQWAAELPQETLEENDYLANLNTLARCGCVAGKTAGLAASIVPAYRREKDREVELARKAALPPSNWIGEPKQRLTMTLTCENIIRLESDYGVTGLHIMRDPAGNVVKWFASGSDWLGVGQTWEVKATVKTHDEYKDVKQTIVQRLKKIKECKEV